MDIENEASLLAALAHGVNLFLGAGFSSLALNIDGKDLPVGSALTDELCDVFNVKHKNLGLPYVCTIIEASQKKELHDYLKRRYTVGSFDPRYKQLEKITIKSIITTNIDDLPFKIFADSKVNYINDHDIHGPAYTDRAAVDLITLHGCVTDDSRPFRFATADLASAFGSDPDRWHYLTGRLQKNPTLFWGYSVADAGALQALHSETIRGRQHQDKWIVLRTKKDDGSEDYYRALGFHIIHADTSELLDYLGRVNLPTAPLPHKGAPTRELFPNEAIPAVGTVVVRPIVDFFLGAPPRWYDIFSNAIHRTSHFTKVKNSVLEGKNTAIIGIPACGKTTLLMQLAADIDFNGHKLMLESLTAERASYIGERLGGEPALIILDNMTDSVDGLLRISAIPGVQILGGDRDFDFEVVAHKLSELKLRVLDVTDLTPGDVQECLSRIPESILRASPGRITNHKRVQPSLFEVIESNVKDGSLKERFRDVLRNLESRSEDLRDLFVMMCYVGRCRTPVSFDMAYAFLSDTITDFKDIYIMFDSLGALVTRYIDGVVDTDQDYFSPRSIIVGEAGIASTSGVVLKRVLERFHRRVSPYRICQYHTFKRRAADATLIGRAFPNWEEGKGFYEEIFRRDDSPYTLQQAAIYLSKKKKHTEAFEMIDSAIVQCSGRIFSIRNTHAIILFAANIDHFNDPEARATLRQSMEILSECYISDKRNPFHAITFADQALKYWERGRDAKGQEYLSTANEWLSDELAKSPWNRAVKYLLPRIRRELDSQR